MSHLWRILACIFMEMQWIHSACIHSGEFFHGPFEITDANTPFFFQFSEGNTRAVDERALNFLKKYDQRYHPETFTEGECVIGAGRC